MPRARGAYQGARLRSGLDVLLADDALLSRHLRGRRVGLCCNHTAVTTDLDHALPRLRAAGVEIRRLFGPEHGIDSTAQDMIAVQDGETDGGRALPLPATVSLYGDSEASLHPPAETLADLDVLVFDIQDIGARYYTYQATLAYIMEVAGRVGCEILVLDRPNPIDGVSLEGNVVRPGFESFVSAMPLAIRHGMTMGELATFFQRFCGIDCKVTTIPSEGWRRELWLDDTGLPWVYPSPNMPTLDTAGIYPGLCLVEGTNLSEGRGTCRPFHLVGAPWLDPEGLARLCRQGALDNHLGGVAFRAATFEPRFQKHAGQICHGVEIFVTDRYAMEPVLLGLVVLEAALRANPDQFKWRTEVYEFVADPIAIDLLSGSADIRLGLEARMRPRDLIEGWAPELAAFQEQREACLRY